MELTLATGDYAHTRGLEALAPPAPDGTPIHLRHLRDVPSAIFRAALSPEAPYDISELSLASTYVLADQGTPPMVALPIFPSRMFRHAAFYVRPGVRSPEDLRGGRIGVVRYGMTAAVWARALLQGEYGLAPEDLQWWVGETQFFPPGGMRVHQAEGQAGLEAMLEGGDLDALFSVIVPRAFREGRVERLFPGFAAAERAQFARDGLYPVMHCIAVKRGLLAAHPWLGDWVMAAFTAAKHAALEWLLDTDASTLPLPFQHGWAEEARTLLGPDPWPYGLPANRPVLEAFGRMMHTQGLTRRALTPEEVFSPGL